MAKKSKKKKSEKLQGYRKIIQSTQKQIPIRDITNNVIITTDDRLVKLLEIQPQPFTNMRATDQNRIRSLFQNFLSVIPSSVQIKSVSVPADLSKQINKVRNSLENETNSECQKVGKEYISALKKTQKNNVERKFYIAISDDDYTVRKNKIDEIEKAIYKLNYNITNQICSQLSSCGNDTKPLDNFETAEVLYRLLNRNSSYITSFNEHYNSIYQKYVSASNDKNIYIPPTELIAPKKINYSDKKFVACDDKYYTFLYIDGNGYPISAVCGWLDMFVNSYEGVDLDIYLVRKSKEKTKGDIRQTLAHTEFDIDRNANDMSDSFYGATNKQESARFLMNCIRQGQAIFDTSILITISGNTIDEVGQKAENIIDSAKVYDIVLRDLRNQEEMAFISALPLNQLNSRISNKANRNMPEVSASTLYPFNTTQLIHENGIYVANSILSGSPLVPDFYAKDYAPNPHIFVCGSSGVGKTSTLELLVLRARTLGIDIFVIVPEKQQDYERLAKAIGGQYVLIEQGSKDRINIMDIRQHKKEKGVLLELKIGVIIEFISILYKDMSINEKTILNEALIQTYKRFGITDDNNSIWLDKEKGVYKDMPILSDLVETLSEMGSKAENLMSAVKYLTTGSCRFFNGKTTVEINNKFFVIGIENNTKETIDLASYLAEDFIQERIREDRITKSIFAIDEGWAMLRTKANAEKLKEDSKILRGYGCSLVFATQQLSDVFKSEQGITILNNSDTRILLKHTTEDAKYVSEILDLTESELNQIKKFQIGEALFVNSKNRMPIRFEPTEFEALLTWNDEKTLKRYDKYLKEKQLQKEQEAQRLKDTKKLKKLIKRDEKIPRVLSSKEYYKLVESENKNYEINVKR